MNDKRRIEMTLEIARSREDVWRALTEAQELVRWFPLQAVVEPGVGGAIEMHWGEALCNRCPIETWEPYDHLRMLWSEGSGERRLAVDFMLEGQGNHTCLRLVHSGFGDDDGWEDEYDGIRRGWQFELRSLKHYLERHFGHRRRVALHRLHLNCASKALWQKIVGPEGLFKVADPDRLSSDERFPMGLPDGGTTDARLVAYNPVQDFSAIADCLGQGHIRIAIETCGGPLELWFWAISWTQEQATLDAFAETCWARIRATMGGNGH